MNYEVFLDGTLLDTDEFNASFTFNVADIREPENRDGHFSKTIVFPGSKVNNAAFGYIFEIDIDGNFNPHVKNECVVYADTIEIFRGSLRLMKVNQVDKDDIEYECSLISSVADLFQQLDQLKLKDLDLSEYDHDYNKTNQENSWATSIIKNGSAYVNFSGGNPTGEGYVYPLVRYGFNQHKPFDVTHLAPWVYAKTYLDKIFEDAGFTYSSNFFDSTLFKRLIISPDWRGMKLTEADVDDNLFRSELTNGPLPDDTKYRAAGIAGPAQTNPLTYVIPFNNDSTGSNFDNGPVYNTITGKFSPNMNTKQVLSGTVIVQDRYMCSGSAVNQWQVTAGTISVWVMVKKFDGTSTTTVHSEHLDITPPTAIQTTATFNGSFYSIPYETPEIQMVTTDEFWIEVTFQLTPNLTINIISSNSPTPFARVLVRAINASFFQNTVINDHLPEGETVDMNSIAADMTQREFLLSLIRMFNLYVELDKDTQNNYIIEPREDYFNNDIEDWTYKLDHNQELSIEPVSEAREFQFRYKEDKDYFNDRYQKAHNEPYGSHTVEVEDDFNSTVRTTEIAFSPTPTTKYGNIHIPHIINIDQNGVVSPSEHNPRILYYAGLKTGSWSYSDLSGTTVETSYPFAGHMDDITTPTIDLSWSWPLTVFYTTNAYTTNGLYNVYWKEYIDQIADKDSKLVTGYFRLRPDDIHRLDFRKLFFVDGTYYRLNKIEDYDPESEEPCLVELIRLVKGVAFTGETVVINGGKDSDVTWSSNGPADNNVSDGGSVQRVIGGTDNIVHSTSYAVSIQGSGNAVHADCKNISIKGDNNTILAGCENVILDNVSGKVIKKSNVHFVAGGYFKNGVLIPDASVIDGGLDEVRNPFATNSITTIEGGLNEVRSPFATNPITSIDGNDE